MNVGCHSYKRLLPVAYRDSLKIPVLPNIIPSKINIVKLNFAVVYEYVVISCKTIHFIIITYCVVTVISFKY